MHKEELTGKLAVVTGGSRGIGRFVAAALHRAGATVVITGRNERTITHTANEIGIRCEGIVCDHRDPDAIDQLAEKVLEQHGGGPDILVNNAGVMHHSPVQDMPLELWDDVINTNLRGTFLTTRAFLPAMLEKEQSDVFIISSMSGKKGDPGGAAYAASKFGLQGFAQSLQYEVRKRNMRVMVLNPSSVNTGADITPDYGPGELLHAADIAATIVHLACMPSRTLIRDMDIWGTNP